MNTSIYFANWRIWWRGWGKLRTVHFKPGWTAWGWKPFWMVYGSTMLLGVLLGFGVVSISRVCAGTPLGNAIDWVFQYVLRQGPNHCRGAGGRLWGSRSVW